VPKATVNEEGYSVSWPAEIRLSNYWPVLAIAFDAGSPKQFSYTFFSAFVLT
jgi:hypothetical protein